MLDAARTADSQSYLEIPDIDPSWVSVLGDELIQRSVWAKGMELERLADPCLLAAAKAIGATASELERAHRALSSATTG